MYGLGLGQARVLPKLDTFIWPGSFLDEKKITKKLWVYDLVPRIVSNGTPYDVTFRPFLWCDGSFKGTVYSDRNLRYIGYTLTIRREVILKGHHFDAPDFGIFTRITSVLAGLIG